MAKLRRGFIKEAEEYSTEFRSELGLRSYDPLCPFELSSHLAVPVIGLSDFPDMPQNVIEHFHNEGFRKFSATTLVNGSKRTILHNDAHTSVRVNSNIAHELAHIILGHEPHPPMIEDKCRHFDANLEAEASALGYTLLIPKWSALMAVEDFEFEAEAAEYFGVSVSLLRHRIGRTNARKWAKHRTTSSYKRYG